MDTILGILHCSEISYEKLIEDFMKYNSTHVSANRDDVYRMAYQSVYEELSLQERLIPYTTSAVIKLPEFPNQKSPDLPWKLLEYTTKKDLRILRTYPL